MEEVRKIIDKNKEIAIIPDGIAVIGKDLRIIVFNEAASRITGYGEEDIIGKECALLFEKNPDHLKYLKDSLNNNRVFTNLPIEISGKGGKTLSVLSSISPIVTDDIVLSSVLVFRNANEMITLAEDIEKITNELLDQKNKLDAIFNSNIEGTFTIDNEWTVTSFNLSAEKITGYKKAEAMGKKCWDIFNSTICRNGCHMEQTMKKGKPMIGNELEIEHKGGKKIPIRVNSGLLLNNKRERIGAVETFIDISELRNLSAHLNEIFNYENIIGRNKEFKQIFSILESVSQTDSTVLITGESGTGKELAARAIHLNSLKKNGPFVAINCSAFVESLIESELFGHEKGAFTGAVKSKTGRLELAQGGTLFLDEVGDLSQGIQTKLLRVLELREFEKVGSNKPVKVNTRIIAATNKDLNEEIKNGRFREDLFYRINVVNIHLPALRDRLDDLPLLVNHFIENFNKKFNRSIKRLSSEAFDLLMEYKWPGNIRELENVIEHCFVLCSGEIIPPECLPKRLRDGANLNDAKISTGTDLKEAEKKLIINLLNKNNWNRTKTAGDLNIDNSTLWRKMKKFEIKQN